ncbi:MAG: cytochrome c [Chlorobi bacterium]|nr:cytochrome c [Chlorobiota bacterium]
MSNAKKNIIVISTLIVIFSIYNFSVYNLRDYKQPVKLSSKAIQGQQLWQENNCWSCHQIYGLGGYLGPDLTNTFSNPKKGKEYIKTFLNSGIKSMPKFNFSEDEKESIAIFLKYIDSTGYYPNYEANFKLNGWVELKYKDEE